MITNTLTLTPLHDVRFGTSNIGLGRKAAQLQVAALKPWWG